MKTIIEAKNLSKRYWISHQKKASYHTLQDEIINIFKKPINLARRQGSAGEYIWALKDVSFSLEPGKTLGIIGPNGAGKSTLLKILTRITPPTEGLAVMRGVAGSLLEVGTGFHPELTGRENIFLNGSILGMKNNEIKKKFNEIVEFAGIEKFLDTPVKHYSSGMYVRLAFSVAAHLEPDILLVDEVLSVGDAEFQKKSLGKMEEITQKGGRTIIFVSHNMQAIRELCQSCILLEQGQIKMIGPSAAVIDSYLKSGSKNSIPKRIIDKNKEMYIEGARVLNEKGEETSRIGLGSNFKVKIGYNVNKEISNVIVGLQIISNRSEKSLVFSTDVDSSESFLYKREKGKYEALVEVNNLFLNADSYIVRISVLTPGAILYDFLHIPLEVIEEEKFSNVSPHFQLGSVVNKLKWVTNKV